MRRIPITPMLLLGSAMASGIAMALSKNEKVERKEKEKPTNGFSNMSRQQRRAALRAQRKKQK